MLQGLFKGVDFTKHHKCAVIDLLPYDASLPHAVMELMCSENNMIPSMRVCSILWTGKEDENRNAQKWMFKEVRNLMYLLVKTGRLKLPGFVQGPPASVAEDVRPAYKEDEYTLTKPQENNLLPLLQSVPTAVFSCYLDGNTVLRGLHSQGLLSCRHRNLVCNVMHIVWFKVHDLWEDDADFNAAFKEVARIHNEQYNPTGVPWKPKRLADTELDQSVDSRAQVLQAASTTKDQLAAKGDLVCVLGTEPNYELLVCMDGHLWVHALNDGILSDQVPLCGCGNYQYVLGSEADQVSQGQGAPRHLRAQNDRYTLSLCMSIVEECSEYCLLQWAR